MKAFLSHSWSDAEFVRAVAGELGRQFTWLDVHAFDTGDDFIPDPAWKRASTALK
jgi:hypothetical protein